MKMPSENQLKLAAHISSVAEEMAKTAVTNSNPSHVERALQALTNSLDSSTHADMLMVISALIAFQAHMFAADQDKPLDVATTLVSAIVAILAQHATVMEVPTNPKDIH